MNPSQPASFRALSPEHYGVLLVILAVGAVMVFAARRRLTGLQRSLEVLLAVTLLLQWPLSLWVGHATGTLTQENQYPCHLCDLAAMLAIVALLTHRAFFCELVYFWGLAGTMQGLLTPALEWNWPHPGFILFFVNHGGIVITALYMVIGRGVIPRAWAKWRAWFLLLGYVGAIGLFNKVMGTNYGFLCHKPATASLFDALGPWPWYLGSAALFGLALFIVLDLPLIPARRRQRPQSQQVP